MPAPEKSWASEMVDHAMREVEKTQAADRRLGLRLLVAFACGRLSLQAIDDLESGILALTGDGDQAVLREAFADARRRRIVARVVELFGLLG